MWPLTNFWWPMPPSVIVRVSWTGATKVALDCILLVRNRHMVFKPLAYLSVYHSLRSSNVFPSSAVLFVVNFMMGNICNVLGKLSHHLTKLIGDRLSNGILMKSLVVVIIVIIQLLVSVLVARAIIFFLLLISGDIEQDPGPGNIDCM